MADFNTAVALVLKHEGGLVDNPQDPGGLTNFGISKRAYPSLDIANLTVDDAKAIYQRDYWKPFMEQEVDQRIANCALDCAVNQGLAVAEQYYLHFPAIKEFQLARLLRYAALAKPQFNHSWFQRVLDV
jgi:lysozyme family protein